MAIEHFSKDSEHFFLSSMYPVPGGIEIPEGIVVAAAENIYQAGKFEHPAMRLQVLEAETGYRAKKVANRLESEGVPVREDWPDIKIDVMTEAVARKFKAGSRMAYLILCTGSEELIQGNRHGDTFWGVSPIGSRNGENHLGRILMDRRQALRRDFHL